ncbi:MULTISPECIES: cytochrome bd oxidase small subunit CydS [Bacillaceae]|uniref:Uncharacterized protein n=1 Tax=Evansella alkalicola TaxID=745819 RepID=A0ABS6JQ29_9BACI|nr:MULTISPECIES: hypothetical protein [Bacillaceae]MBU9720367.1 hypothetical protein [Bacillus alkalicola]
MDITQFLIMIAPPLVMVACVALVFLWATYGKTPNYINEDKDKDNNEPVQKVANQ